MAKSSDVRYVATGPIAPPGAGPGVWAFQAGDEVPGTWVEQHADHLEALAGDGPKLIAQTPAAKLGDTQVKAREDAAGHPAPSATPPVTP